MDVLPEREEMIFDLFDFTAIVIGLQDKKENQ
jgi:hypothetical protein